MYSSSICMMSGVSPAAISVASLPQYAVLSALCGSMVMLGYFSSNALITLFVMAVRASFPHQVKLRVTGLSDTVGWSVGPPLLEQADRASAVTAVTARKAAALLMMRCVPLIASILSICFVVHLFATRRGNPSDEIPLSEEEDEEHRDERQHAHGKQRTPRGG